MHLRYQFGPRSKQTFYSIKTSQCCMGDRCQVLGL